MNIFMHAVATDASDGCEWLCKWKDYFISARIKLAKGDEGFLAEINFLKEFNLCKKKN